MSQASIDRKFAAQNRLVEELINAQTAKIEAQTAVISSQNVAIEAVMRLLIEIGEEIKASGERKTNALESFGKRRAGALKSLEGSMKSLEARFDVHHGRLLGRHIKLMWTIVGAAMLAAPAAVGESVKDLFGL